MSTLGKSRVVLTSKDEQHKEWKKSERGYVDGYIRGADERPYAVVRLDRGVFVMVPLHVLKAV